MIKIAITIEAFEAIASTLPLGSVRRTSTPRANATCRSAASDH